MFTEITNEPRITLEDWLQLPPSGNKCKPKSFIVTSLMLIGMSFNRHFKVRLPRDFINARTDFIKIGLECFFKVITAMEVFLFISHVFIIGLTSYLFVR